MSRNIEIKARARDFAAQRRIAEQLADQPPVHLEQTDSFFHAAHGRLKLREFGDGRGELIQYQRSDSTGPKTSHYTLVPTEHPIALRQALTAALGLRATVVKRRHVCLCGQTRIHLDRVEGLGEFIELEVVLAAEQTEQHGQSIADSLMRQLGVTDQDLIAGAYVDLLEQKTTREKESSHENIHSGWHHQRHDDVGKPGPQRRQ